MPDAWRNGAKSGYWRGVFGGAAVTDRQGSGTNGGPAVTSGWREDLGFTLIFVPLACGIGLVNVLSQLDERQESGQVIPAWMPATWEGSSVLVICALGPAVLWLTRRVWPLARPRWRVVLLHALGLLAFTVVHAIVAGVIRWGVHGLMGDFYSPFALLADFVYELRKDVLIYIGIVTGYVIWRLYRSQRGAPVFTPAAVDEAIEVRDGARRYFVPLSEVAWIEAAGNYVELHRGATPILHRAPLSEMERQLQGAGFVRIHRSRLVRRAAVEQVESKPSGDYVVRLADGRELAGSRRYRRPLLEP